MRLFGAPQLHAGAVTHFVPERRFQLLALLALHGGEWVSRDRVAALLWPDRTNAEARRNLRKVLFRAHGLPGANDVEANEHALRWTVGTDLQAFAAAFDAGRFGDALALRCGPLLAGLDDADNGAWTDWLGAERARWHSAWHQAALGELERIPAPAQHIRIAQALLAVDPLDEAAWTALIDAQLALGHAGDARRSYDDYAARLARELGVEPARSLRERLVVTVAAASAAAAAPSPAAAFIGRRTELAELARVLANPERRQVTLIGPGGIGKSSLAQRAHATAGALFPGGTLWLELQDLGDVGAVAARLAEQLGIELDDRRDPVAQIARRLPPERTLFVLDNAEHLADLPALVRGLLGAAPALTLLLTSRVRTHDSHEHLLPLAGLAVPDEDSRDLDAAGSFDAVRLFELRAAAAAPGFRLAGHLGAVIDITEAVAGMPLAIELAASWVRLLPVEEIARDLGGLLDLLERDPACPGQPARPEHHSMRAVLDRSWQLLAPRERQALAGLSVFQGGFMRPAAQRVAAVALPLLSSLADRSLIAADASGRFSLHPLVAAYAADKLADDPKQLAAARGRHAEFFALHLAALAPHAIGDQRRLVDGVTREFANCLAAWRCAVDRQRVDLVAAMVRALWSYFENRGRLREGIELLGPALALPGRGADAARARARLHHGLSMLHHRRGDNAVALELARDGVAGAEHCGDTEAYVGCVINTGMCLWYDGHLQQARAWYERGLAIARARGDQHCTAWALGNLGNCLVSLGEPELAHEHLLQALSGSRALGDQYNVGVHLINLGSLLRDRGDKRAALERYQEGLRHCTAFGIDSLVMYLHSNLGHLRLEIGEPAVACRHYEQALRTARERGVGLIEWGAELGLARAEIGAGAADAAVRRLQRVARAALERSSPSELAAAAALYGDVRAARGDTAAAAQIWRMALEQVGLPVSARRRVEGKLATLSAEPQTASAAPALEEVLRQLEAEARAAR